MRKLIKKIRHELAEYYSESETNALIQIIAIDILGISNTAFFLRDEIAVTPTQEEVVTQCIERLKKWEPIQYIIGETEFCNHKFKVNPSVLIPRPETSELVQWIIAETPQKPYNILDIGTGSGCIAISLDKELPQAQVKAWDISDKAIETARSNNALNSTNVTFEHCNILDYTPEEAQFEIIVSNPPYIKEVEKENMESNVLDWEPATALFVPDNDPLLFYRAIAVKARTMLTSGGKLYFEINREYGAEICSLLASLGYSDIELRKDFADNDRMIRAVK